MPILLDVTTTLPRLPSGPGLRAGLLLGLRRWFALAQSRARALAPVGSGPAGRYGRLRANIRAHVFSKGDLIIGRLTRGHSFYGAILEADPYKSAAHPWDITPRKAHALRFSIGGQVIFAQRVQHPGLRAYPHFMPAWRMGRPELVPQLTQGLAEAFQKEAGGGAP